MTPTQHDHPLTFAVTTGSQWLWVLVLAGVTTVTAAALLRPAVPEAVRSAQLVVAAAAGGVGLLLLLLAPGLDLPRQVVALLVVAMAVPVAVARHPAGPGAPGWVHPVRRAAPLIVTAATVAAGIELVRAWLGGPLAQTEALRYTGLFLGIVGLSWLVVCGHRSRPVAAAAVHGTGWLLANAVLGAAIITAIAALPA